MKWLWRLSYSSGIIVYSDSNLLGFEHAIDFVIVSEDQTKLWILLGCRNDSLAMFGIRFVCSKCKVFLEE